MGISFCHVARIRHIGHEIEFITDGNQKWNGARPSLTISPSIMITDKAPDVDPSSNSLDPNA
jgi:hypothetical protein